MRKQYGGHHIRRHHFQKPVLNENIPAGDIWMYNPSWLANSSMHKSKLQEVY